MNLLIVSQYFWPESFRINDLARRVSGEGVNVTVLTGQPNYPEGKVFSGYSWWQTNSESHDGMDVLRVPLVPRGPGRAVRLIANYLSFVFGASILGPFLMRRRPIDVIFVYGISPILQAVPAVFLKWLKGAKLVVWVQDLWPESLEATGFVKNRLALSLVGWVVKWIYNHADSVFVQSEAFIEPVAQFCSRDKIVYYPNSAEDAVTSASSEPECPIPDLKQCFSVVFAGALGTAQALDVILDAAERLKHDESIRFFLVGHGSRSEWTRGQIEARHLTNIVMAGRYPVEAMPSVFASASALLVTLTDDPIFSKTVPSKVQSYLAAGRPILGCISGEGARVINAAQAGLTCNAMDVDGLVRSVETLYRMSPDEREALGKNGRRYFENNFESHKLTTELIDKFRSIIDVASA
ncbi:glycosyltransferase family 4 protein [Paraburkholderia hospita]|uniref:glycosyltransferase family 4 protein n=1 Tax=Paraburkholderia hospita TaxID=169430 RepID=UPI000B3431E0|nr:glycosyltransferase family 4 protein [Paraburkholderia hospita]OUL88667.1 glycosyltransferase WbuB [Paraburkholderia hospita]